jgi:hypothetical protein
VAAPDDDRVVDVRSHAGSILPVRVDPYHEP